MRQAESKLIACAWKLYVGYTEVFNRGTGHSSITTTLGVMDSQRQSLMISVATETFAAAVLPHMGARRYLLLS